MIIQLSLLVFLMVISLGPGLLIARRLRLSPLERLCTAIGISGITIYLLATAIYLTGINWQCTYLISGLSLVAFLFNLREFRQLLYNHAARRTLGGFALLFIWTLLLLMLVRNYSGGIWSGDWFEHYDRTQFFLHRGDLNHLFIGLYLLPARPPMMNLIAAFFLAQVGRGFPAYELCFAILSLTAFLPAALLLNHLRRRGARALWFLAAALACNPFFAQNLTYTWTKLYCAFYVLLAIALYLRHRRLLAFVMMAAGCLVHYSAGPFAIYLAVNYLWNSLHHRVKWREILAIFFLCAAFLATWFAWSIDRFGLRNTLATNTTVTDSAKFTPAENTAKIAKNIADSIVPPILGRMDSRWRDQSMLGFVRDAAFVCYQQNMLLMLGSGGAIAALWILWRTSIQRPRKWTFWFGLILFCVPLAIATVGEYEPLGLAHAVLQPLALIGIAAVAANIARMPRWLFRVLLAGWLLDFLLGICLQAYLESLTFEAVSASGGHLFWSMPIKLVLTAFENFNSKQIFNISFIGDHTSDAAPALLAILIIANLCALYWLTQNRRRILHPYVNGNRRAVARKLS